MPWGILAPNTIISQRRQQNLDLASALRHFNDRSVPDLGGMWLPMPIPWSVLAVYISDDLGVSALPVGNAVEAPLAGDKGLVQTQTEAVQETATLPSGM